jgi:hypothetical protein
MPNDLAARLAIMSETELTELGAQYDALTDEAQAFVRAEFARRSLDAPLIDDQPSAPEFQRVRTIRQYRDQAAAMMARSVLESAGIACLLRDENTVGMDWLWSNLMGGIRLQVAEEDVEAAEALLSQPIPESIAVEGEADFDQPHCPRCGALDISVVNVNTKVGAASMLILGFPVQSPIARDTWLCDKCGCRWVDEPDPSTAEPEAVQR